MKQLKLFRLLVPLVMAQVAAQGQTDIVYSWTNFAGLAGGPGNADGLGQNARFNRPEGVAVDTSGNLYVADTGNNTIRKVTIGTNILITTIAGLPGVSGATDGLGRAARFSLPYGVAVDTSGSVFVADTSNHTIRKITPVAGNVWSVTTLAGRAGSPGSTDGTGGAALFSYPRAVTLDSAGNLFVADNCAIRKVTSTGVVTTPAGNAGNCGCADGTGGAARFWIPSGIAADAFGSVWVADTANQVIRRLTSAGAVQTLAGSCGMAGCANGMLGAAAFSSPLGVAVDGAGNLYVADSANNTIRRITSAGVVTTLAGTCGMAGSTDGTNSAARFNQPAGLAVDSGGNLYVADSLNNTIRRLSLSGTNWLVTTIAGSASGAGNANGTNALARFNGPRGVAVDNLGDVYIADANNGSIRKVDSAAAVTTVAGGPGSMGCAGFNQPNGLAFNTNGNLLVADTSNCVIRQVTASGVVTTLAGLCGLCGSTDGPGAAAQFNGPVGVAADSNNVFVADTLNSSIRRVNGGVVSTFAGGTGLPGTNDGPGLWASFNQPYNVAVDSAGTLYVADRANHTIRKITSSGFVSTLAGLPGVSGANDGTNSTARFNLPSGVAVDPNGTIFVADTGNHTIRRVTSAGVVTTIGGGASMIGGSDGLGTNAAFSAPIGVAVDHTGSLWVVDANENRLIRGQPAVPVLTTTRVADKIIVSWPAAYNGYVLQQNASIGNAGTWSNSAYPVTDNGTTKSVTIASPPARLLFRLVGN